MKNSLRNSAIADGLIKCNTVNIYTIRIVLLTGGPISRCILNMFLNILTYAAPYAYEDKFAKAFLIRNFHRMKNQICITFFNSVPKCKRREFDKFAIVRIHGTCFKQCLLKDIPRLMLDISLHLMQYCPSIMTSQKNREYMCFKL